MAQTKRRRKRKHRGTQAGTIEARGRTGRTGGGGAAPKKTSADRRMERLSKPPTWRGSLTRAGVAAVLFTLVVIVAFQQPVASGIALGLVMIAIYLPMTYYTDRFLHRRHMRRQARG